MSILLRLLSLVASLLAVPHGALADTTGPIRVIDGDTIDVQGTRIRLHGIDALEKDQTCTDANGTVWACGAWVTEAVRARFAGQTAHCTAMDTDRYHRTIAKCSFAGEDMGQILVSAGWAFAYRKYSLEYDLDEKGAAIRNTGLHASTVQTPAAFRQGRATADQERTGACRIKGNISAKGVRIFHRPGQRDYARTRISPNKGERWFCSPTEARAAGWRAARR